MAGRRSTCPELSAREATGDDEQLHRGQHTSLLKSFGRRHSAPVARTAGSVVNDSAEITDRDPVPAVPSDEPPPPAPRRRVRPPVPTPRVTLLSVYQRRQLEESTIDESGTSDLTAARSGSLPPWPNNDLYSCSMRPTAKPRKLKPLRPRGMEVVLPSTICSIPATGDHAHPLYAKSFRKDNVRSAPSVLPHFADESAGQKRSDMAVMDNYSQRLHADHRQNYENEENDDKKLMSSPSSTTQLTPSQSDTKRNPEEKKPEEVSTTSDASLMPRTKHNILLTFALVGVVILCVWTFYSSKTAHYVP
ncbi:hypothetical protein MTO96_026887 [Rhipicephalus appendiculatus]